MRNLIVVNRPLGEKMVQSEVDVVDVTNKMLVCTCGSTSTAQEIIRGLTLLDEGLRPPRRTNLVIAMRNAHGQFEVYEPHGGSSGQAMLLATLPTLAEATHAMAMRCQPHRLNFLVQMPEVAVAEYC